MLQFIYVWYSANRFYNTDLPFIYIGSHKGTLDDSYISSSKFLSMEMASDEMQWKRIILVKYDLSVDRSYLNSIESEIIKKAFNRYGRNRCVNMVYNQFNNKHFNTKGLCRLINCKTGKIEIIYRHLKPFLLKNGYSLTAGTTKNRICITNGTINKFVEINSKIESNWTYGMTMKRPAGFSSIPKGNICIHKNNQHKFINIEETLKYLHDGWNKGFSSELKLKLKNSSQKGKKRMEKSGQIKFIDIDLFDIYIENGWVSPIGSIPKGSICINNGITNKYINSANLNTYLIDGWNKGELPAKKDSIPKGSICINNGITNKYIQSSEIDTYLNLGWNKGMINHNTHKAKKCINNKLIHKYVCDNELNKYLNNGWNLGRIKTAKL